MKKIYYLLIAVSLGFSSYSQTENGSSGQSSKVEAPCNLGTGWTQVPSIPYTSASLTTCGQVDDIKTTNPVICGSSSYYGGEDVVYTFTPTTSGPVGVSVTSTGSWVGLVVYTGCPVANAAVCVASSQSSAGNQSVCINVTAGTSYAVVIDSWPAPTCNPYQLNISSCSGPPTSGTASAAPSISCVTYTTNLSLNGASSTCGITYQWQSAPAAAGPWTNITGATASTATANVTATTYYRCVLACGVSTATSAIATASMTAVGPCGICNVVNITIPYNVTGQTTCGNGNNVTSTNVTNICGSSSYYGGEDATYCFTATTTGQLGINVTSTGSFMGLMLYQGCPVTGGTCVGNAQSAAGNQSLCANVTAGQVYYLTLDSWPAPTCNPYDLSITGCTGAPPTGTTMATPNVRCSAFTTSLSLNGVVACGYSFQWQSAPASTGPWSNIAGATANTATANVTVSGTYYRCIVSCGAFTSTSTAVGTTITPSGMCGLCGVSPITLPYSITGTTTCGAGDDLTAAMVTNTCGSTSYLGGEDVIYTFTPSTSGQITITYSTSGSSAGLTLYNGCPNSTGTCAGNLQGISSFSGNQTMCLNVTAGQPYFLVIDSWPTPTCNGYNISITAPTGTVPTCVLSNYSSAAITYSFDTFVGTLTPSTDDVLYSNVVLFGFNFCFAGSSYTGGYIASNGSFVFDAVPCFPNVYVNQYAAAGISTGWQNTAAAPSQVSTTSLPQNAVNAPWQDINPSLGGVIRYSTLGTAPNRRFVVSYENVPMFSCGTSSPAIYYTGQIKLYETSNNIEMHVGNKGICPGWNSGSAIMGLTSYDGLTYVPPVNMTAHNYPTNWNMTNTAYRFTAPCLTTGPCAVLPIQFSRFYGEHKDKVNHLYWESATEQNIKTFIVERSVDAENFIELAKVAPNNRPSKYQYDDATFAPGTMNYYKITSVDYDGTRNSTNVIALGATDGETAVSGIYPNPVKNDFTMSIESKKATSLIINVQNALGRIVKTYISDIGIGVSQLHFNCEDLPAGIYILETTDSNKNIVSKQRMIKMN